jgi:DNA polymerase-3 subunit beta
MLNTALRGLRLVKPRKTTLPVLDCVHLSSDGSAVELTTTDLDQRLTFQGELAEPSNRLTRLVPLSVLQRIAKELPKETVFSFDKAGQIACVVGGTTTWVPFDAPGVEEFPGLVETTGQEIELPPEAVSALQEARFVASEDGHRPSICCVCLEKTNVIATDGRQLYNANSLALPLKSPCLLPPLKSLNVFDGTAPAILRLPATEKSQAFTLRQGPWTWQAKVVSENYPNWRQVLPAKDEPCTEINFSTQDLVRLRQIVGLIAHDAQQSRVMALFVRGRQLLAVTGKGDQAQTHELHPISLKGTDCHAWFNADFLVRAIDFGFDQLRVRNAKTVVVAHDEHREYLFMPFNVEGDQLPAALRPPVTTAPEQNNPTTTNHTETNPTNTDPMPKTTSTATAAATAPEAPTPTATATGQAQPTTASAADKLLSQWLEARESARVALERLDAIRGSLKNVAREYRELEKEHEALKKSVRSLQKLEV